MASICNQSRRAIAGAALLSSNRAGRLVEKEMARSDEGRGL